MGMRTCQIVDAWVVVVLMSLGRPSHDCSLGNNWSKRGVIVLPGFCDGGQVQWWQCCFCSFLLLIKSVLPQPKSFKVFWHNSPVGTVPIAHLRHKTHGSFQLGLRRPSLFQSLAVALDPSLTPCSLLMMHKLVWVED